MQQSCNRDIHRKYLSSDEGESPMRKTILVVVSLISAAVCGLAQVDTGNLVGTVRDPSGAVLSGVTVTATNVDTGASTVVKTEASGNFVITPLKIGRYSVSAEASGFRKE